MMADASRGPKRKAAQMRNGVTKNVQGSFRMWVWNIDPKTISEMSSVEANSAAASTIWLRDHFQRTLALHSSRNGAKTNPPAASPSHQVRQIIPYCRHGAKPPSARLVTPNVAATGVLKIPAYSAKRRMSHVLSKT